MEWKSMGKQAQLCQQIKLAWEEIEDGFGWYSGRS